MAASKQLRLFLSSTFRDLIPEREYLVKKTFPKIRARCRERGVEFTEIDLRWGITEEESRTGQTVRICLEEIDRCRPYFLGIFGSRYGWIPGIEEIAKDAELLTQFPWLTEYASSNKSIIEMEFAHGVLQDDKQSAFLYEQAGESHTEFAHEREPLERLKSELRASGRDLRSFSSPEELDELVCRDLFALLDREWPAKQELTPLERARAEHDAFAHNRRQTYIANPEYSAVFEEHVRAHDAPLVVWGPSGLGKSALMANLAHEYAVRNPQAFVVQHFVGAAARGGPEEIMRHVMLEINDRYRLNDAIPGDANALREEFPSWLAKIRQDDTLVLFIDALNQLADVAQELHWLPEFIPANIRLVLSTTAATPLVELRKRGWKELELRPLTDEQVGNITTHFLAQYRKRLTPRQLALIAAGEKTRRPLFLRTVLEEVRVFGDHERIEEHLGGFLGSADERELFQRVLARMESDHGAEPVRTVLTAIWASRHGLSEAEILEITTLSRRALSELMIAMEYHLMQREELHTFFHNYLREAVERRYCATDEQQRAAHAMLGAYFSTREFGDRRRIEEPWQWQAAGEKERLREALLEPEMIALFSTPKRQYEAFELWRPFGRIEIDAASLPMLLKEQLPVQTRFDVFMNIIDLLSFADENRHALDVHQAGVPLLDALDLSEEQRMWIRQREILLLNYLGQYDTVIARTGAMLEDEGVMARNPTVRIDLLDNLSHAFSSMDNFEEAERVIRISIREGAKIFGADDSEMTTRWNSLATNLARQGRFDDAESILTDLSARVLSRVGSSHPDFALAKMQLASCRRLAGKTDGVITELAEAADIFVRALGRTHLLTLSCMVQLAEARIQRQDIEGARALLREVLTIMTDKYPDRRQTASWGTTLGFTYYLSGDFATALTYYEQFYPRLVALLGEDNPEVVRRRERIEEMREKLRAQQ